jgi:tetratricopeptide (TPR) repeat protein
VKLDAGIDEWLDVPGKTVVPQARHSRPRGPGIRRVLALILAAGLACSPLDYGYYGLTAWAPLGLGAFVLLVLLLFLGPPTRLGRTARVALGGLALLALLSFASILWAESRDSAWTSANQVAVYGALLALGMLTIREHLSAWSVMMLLGLAALAVALVLSLEFVAGSGAGAFLHSRLNSPMGYVNATAGLMVMGVWPWLGLAERLATRWGRAAAISAAALIAGTAVLTQTRAILPAAALSIALALLAGRGRIRRAVNSIIVLGAVGGGLPWTLDVYRSTGPTHLLSPSGDVLRAAGLALLGTVLLAFLLSVMADAAGQQLTRGGQRLASSRFGRALVVVALGGLVAGAGAAEHGRIATQWHDFTSLNDERSAGDRFLAVGGGPRYDLWRIALDEFAGDPLGGVGAGNYADQEYRLRRAGEHVTNPHSLELQTLAELGVGGAVGLALFVLPVLGAAVRRSRAGRSEAEAGLYPAAAGVFSAWLVATSVDWLYDFPGLTGMALLAAVILVMGAGDARGEPAAGTSGPANRSRGARVSVAVGLGALALLAASLGRQCVAALYSNSGGELVASHPRRALRTLTAAEGLDPWSLKTQYAVAAAYARLDNYSGARAALLRAAQLEPENFVPRALLGDIATRAGDPVAALAAYRQALRLDPHEPVLRRALARARRAAAAR